MVTIVITKSVRSLSPKGDFILQDGRKFCVIEYPQILMDEVQVTTIDMGTSAKRVLKYNLGSEVVIQTHRPEEQNQHSEVF